MNVREPSRDDGADAAPDVADSGLVEAVLRECAEHLAVLAVRPERTAAIDLRSLPMSDGERQALRGRLGRGEVRATVDLGGATRIDETAFAGLWWVRHEAADGGVLAEQIVVARVPELLLAHPADVDEAARRLQAALGANATADSPEKADA